MTGAKTKNTILERKEIMKTKRFVKLMQLLLAAVLTLCLLCAVGISSSATAENALEVGDS